MEKINLIGMLICVISMLINRKDINMIIMYGYLAIINGILYREIRL